MGRQPCCDKSGLKRGPWTIEEDHKLINFIINNGIHCWRLVPKLAGLMRCGKSCRLRWTNYLRPDLKRGAISEEEENQIIQLHSRLGNRWSKIASHFPGRTDNEIKNHWNTRIKKRFKLLGLDPVTHKLSNQPAEKYDHEEANFSSQTTASQAPGRSIDVAEMMGAEQKEIGLSLEDKFGLMHDIWMSCENLDIAEEIKPQVNSASGSCSSSFTVEDSLCPSSTQSVNDSFPSWEAIYPLEDLFFYGNLL